MADFADDLKVFIQGVTAAGDQVYLDRAPQGAPLPFFVITEAAGGSFVETISGAAPLAEAVWHVYAYGVTRISANELAESLRKQLHRYSGDMGTTNVDNVTCEQYRDTDVDDPQDKSYAPRYWTRVIYTIWHAVAGV